MSAAIGSGRVSFRSGRSRSTSRLPVFARLAHGGFISSGEESVLAEDWRPEDLRSAALTRRNPFSPSAAAIARRSWWRVPSPPSPRSSCSTIPRAASISELSGSSMTKIRAAAGSGRCFLWYTTENDELFLCDRVYVFHEQKGRRRRRSIASDRRAPAPRVLRGMMLMSDGGRWNGGAARTTASMRTG